MTLRIHLAATCVGLALAGTASAQITFYEHDDFGGRSFNTTRQISNLQRWGFNDRASSVEVQQHRWEVCQDLRFGGRCMVLQPGRYPSLSAMGLNDRVSSVRQIGDNVRIARDRLAPQPAYDARRRRDERLFEAEVSSVRAVMGEPEMRCWSEPERVRQEDREANVPRALLGAVIGGILGHQIGGGTGRDVATVGGAVVGGVIGGRSGREPEEQTREVQRCAPTAASGRPAYWDVTYRFRGQDHRIQMRRPPGETVTVNRQGEPRV